MTMKLPDIGNKKNKFVLAQMLILICIVLIGILYKEQSLKPIASESDSGIVMTAEDNFISQSWEADSKNIVGLQLGLISQENVNLKGTIRVAVKEERNSESYISVGEVDLQELSGVNQYTIILKQTKLELGKRYFIEIQLLNCDDTIRLVLEANSNYGGMYIGEREAGGSLAADVIFEKTANAAWLIRIFVIFSGLTIFAMLFFKRRFEETLALTVSGIFVFLYLFGVFNRITWGINLLIAVSAAAFIAIPVLISIKNTKLRDIISPGMVAFWGLFLVYFILDRNVATGKVDDLNHWQLCVRDMWYFDSYPFHMGTVVECLRYTPGFATIEYLFTYLYGDFREGIILLACHTIGFSFLSILYSKISWRSWHKAIPVTIMIAGLPLLIYQVHYGILYVDAYLGIIGAFMIICYFTEEKSLFNWMRITLASILLIMAKEMGLAIAGTIYVMFLIDIWKNECKFKWKPLIKSKSFWDMFKSGIISLGIFITWQVYILLNQSKLGLAKPSNNIMEMFGLAKANGQTAGAAIQLVSASDTFAVNSAMNQAAATASTANATPLQTVKEMLHWLLFEKEFIGNSYIELMIIVIVICAALGVAGLYKKLNINMKELIVYLSIGTALYAAFLTVCYLLLFKEASAIPAARRYMGSYLLLFLITIAGVIIVKTNIAETAAGWKQQVAWIICIFIFLNIPDNHPFYTTEQNFGLYFTTWKNHQRIGEVFRSFADKDEKIYYVSYKDSTLVPQYNYLTFFNSVVPNRTQGLDGGWKPVINEEHHYAGYVVSYSTDEWQQLLHDDYSYVYVRDVDSYFTENYGELFENPQDIKDGNIYRINKADNGTVRLSQIAYMDLN